MDSISGTGYLVPDYAFMYAAAVLIGVYLTVREAEKVGLDPATVFWVCLVVVVAALTGSRLFVVLQYWDYYSRHATDIPRIWEGGTASTGAYMGGIAAAFVAAAWYRLPKARFFDCCAPAIAAAIVLGRIGCFLNGCCYGSRSDLPWAVCFPVGAGPYHDQMATGLISEGGASLPVHPVQVYEAMYVFVIFLLLMVYRKWQKRDGELFALLFLLYPCGRFFIEFLRADERGAIGVLSLPQALALVLMAASGVWFLSGKVQKAGRRKFFSRVDKEGQVQA